MEWLFNAHIISSISDYCNDTDRWPPGDHSLISENNCGNLQLRRNWIVALFIGHAIIIALQLTHATIGTWLHCFHKSFTHFTHDSMNFSLKNLPSKLLWSGPYVERFSTTCPRGGCRTINQAEIEASDMSRAVARTLIGGCLFIYSCSARLVSFQIDKFEFDFKRN